MFLGIFGWFKKAFKHIGDAVVAFVKSDAARAILNTLEGQLVNAAVVALSGQSFASLTNAEKRQQAFDNARASIQAAGLEARDSAINLAIETAIASLKNLGPK